MLRLLKINKGENDPLTFACPGRFTFIEQKKVTLSPGSVGERAIEKILLVLPLILNYSIRGVILRLKLQRVRFSALGVCPLRSKRRLGVARASRRIALVVLFLIVISERKLVSCPTDSAAHLIILLLFISYNLIQMIKEIGECQLFGDFGVFIQGILGIVSIFSLLRKDLSQSIT